MQGPADVIRLIFVVAPLMLLFAFLKWFVKTYEQSRISQWLLNGPFK